MEDAPRSTPPAQPTNQPWSIFPPIIIPACACADACDRCVPIAFSRRDQNQTHTDFAAFHRAAKEDVCEAFVSALTEATGFRIACDPAEAAPWSAVRHEYVQLFALENAKNASAMLKVAAQNVATFVLLVGAAMDDVLIGCPAVDTGAMPPLYPNLTKITCMIYIRNDSPEGSPERRIAAELYDTDCGFPPLGWKVTHGGYVLKEPNATNTYLDQVYDADTSQPTANSDPLHTSADMASATFL